MVYKVLVLASRGRTIQEDGTNRMISNENLQIFDRLQILLFEERRLT